MLREHLLKINGVPDYFKRLANRIEQHDSIILFGAGSGGINTLDWIKKNVSNWKEKKICFADNNPLKWGTKLEGYDVYKPSEAIYIYIYKPLVVISCGEGDVIWEQLLELGCDPNHIVIPDLSSIDRSGNDFEYIWAHIDDFEIVYGMLADEKSKMVFRNILNYKINHSGSFLEDIYDHYDMQYFDPDIIEFCEDDVFIDCGSYIGDTIETYLKYNQSRYRSVIALEAAQENYRIICEKFAGNPKIICVNKGVWHQEGTVKFDNIGSGSGMISSDGKNEIRTDTIDHIVGNEPVSFIKMDIEGAEVNALLGAYNTIISQRPTMMISVYHKQDDFIRIPLLIKSFCPDYKFYFRHYRLKSVQETVCYAVCVKR